MTRTTRTTRVLVLLACLLLPARALTIKMGSSAPSGTPWDDAVREMAAGWSTVSGGTVKLKVYPGGIAGDEDDMIRKTKIGQLTAIGISGMGLSHIYSGILAVQLPLLVRTDEELAYVMEKMKPHFEAGLDKAGYKVVTWNNAGWGHFFAKKPVVRPDDLRSQKLFCLAGDADGIQVWKDAGFHPVPLSMSDLLTSLQSGMVDAFTLIPVSAAANQSFALAPNMCNMKWAPLVGAILVNNSTWKRIKPDLQAQMLKVCSQTEKKMQEGINAGSAQAIEVMKKHGLKISHVTPEAEKEWLGETRAAFAKIAGKSFDRKSYELVKKYLAEYRAAHDN